MTMNLQNKITFFFFLSSEASSFLRKDVRKRINRYKSSGIIIKIINLKNLITLFSIFFCILFWNEVDTK